MPIHDWTRVDAGLFHAFHQGWISMLARTLNRGVLPRGYVALSELPARRPAPDVLALNLADVPDESSETSWDLTEATAPPRARVIRSAEDIV
jgi:hypothetical protein